MTRRRSLLSAGALLLACSACDGMAFRPRVDAPVVPPGTIADFDVLYRANCAGCHGPNGEGGVALALSNPVYLLIADDTTIRLVITNGVAGAAMPAFAQTAGGMLTDTQIETIGSGIRARWARPRALEGAEPPPYTATTPGDPTRGAAVYRQFCAACHGAAGRGGPRAGSIVDGSYLALVSDQNLRITIIAGRPDLGHPDWRADVAGTAMSAADVSDVTAWLAARRPHFDAERNGLGKDAR
jgi:cytochrome c oxidase cbb3-type subunit III